MSQKPGKPKVEPCGSNTQLIISWNVPCPDLQSIDYFEIKWKKREEKRWSGLKGTEGNSTFIQIPITEFEKNATYQFAVKWTTKDGKDSQFSEISDDVLITCPRSPHQPGQISSSQTKATSVCLSWGKPKKADTLSYYNIKYGLCEEDKWTSVDTNQPPTEYHDLKNLKSKHAYKFKVRGIFSDGSKGPFSEVSDTVTTQESLATRLKTQGSKLWSAKDKICKLKLVFSDQSTNNTAKTRKGRFGERNHLVSTKTIMFVGATGAGKSTMIDGMINYILDVSWEDDFRFSLIDLTDEEEKKRHQQAVSQTVWITCYEVNHQHGSRLDYNLNIVDTPGFGDTQGPEHDKKVVNQIREFFTAAGEKGIDTIDAVCLIVQSPLSRLTQSQKNIFDSVLYLFGNDIKDNLFVLITFADGTIPPALVALKEAKVPFQNHFSFNNVASTKKTDSSNNIARISWQLGTDNFDNFFDQLRHVKQKSLKLSSQILETRKTLENLLDRLPLQIEAGVQDLDTMKAEAELLKTCLEVAEGSKNYTKLVPKNRTRTVPTTDCVTNCNICKRTCDRRCMLPFNFLKRFCEAMSGGLCTVCPDNCSWDYHKNEPFYYENYFVLEEMTLEEVKKTYELAVLSAKEKTAKLDNFKLKFKSKLEEVISIMKKTRECIIKLKEGALKSDEFSEIDYVKRMVDRAKMEEKLGWKGRVQILEEIIRKARNNTLDSWTDNEIDTFLQTV